MRSYIPPINSDEELFVKRVQELCKLFLQKDITKTTAFLTDRQQELALAQLNRNFCKSYDFFGGEYSKERKILVIGDIEAVKKEVYSIFIKPNSFTIELTHRDYLGALLALGIKRECTGDIIVNKSGALVYLNKSAYNLAFDELREVGKCSVEIFDGENIVLDITQNEYQEKTASVASLRLDNVLCAMCNFQRSKAQELVREKLVEVNHMPVNSVHFDMQENDIVSIKGKGKYKLCEIGSKSRKNRIFIKYICY